MSAVTAIGHNVATRLLRIRRMIGLALLTGMPAGVLFFVTFGNTDEDIGDIYVALTVTVLLLIALPVAALVLSSAAFGEERRDQTLPFLIVKPVPRWVIAIAVTAAGILATLVVGGIGVLGGWAVAAVATSDYAIGLPTVVALVVAAMGYGAVFVPLGLLVGRSTLAGLAYIFIWETILGSFVPGISAASVFRTSVSAFADVGTLSPEGQEIAESVLADVVPGVGGAFAKVGVALVISLLVTTWVLRRRDLAKE
jgi:ABC-2 type transport system permease protein